MFHPPPQLPLPTFPPPAATVTVNTVYYDREFQNMFVNLKGIRGTAWIDECDGRPMIISILKIPGSTYRAVFLQCKADKHYKAIFVK